MTKKKFNKERFLKLIDGTVKWLGICFIGLGVLAFSISIYHYTAKTSEKWRIGCKTILEEKELSESQTINRNLRYNACIDQGYDDVNTANSNTLNYTTLGGLILFGRFITKKIASYLWT